MQTHFDYIIIGAGLSGYTTALRMARDSYFNTKAIAIIDPNFSKENDRTWCFWETDKNIYEEIVSYQWDSILVKGNGLEKPITISPYSYKKIEGKDLYSFAKTELSSYSNITLIESKVIALKDIMDRINVITTERSYIAIQVLDSRYNPQVLNNQKQAVVLQQHFLGWFVKTKEAVFTPDIATYMDFSVPQKGNCRFMYVLPTSQNEALLEYTLFSQNLLAEEEYEEAIKEYLHHLGVTDYTITAREHGSIPMTTYDFTQHNTHNLLHIGTGGGWTKASTGYTFTHTLKRSKKLISFLKTDSSFTSYKLKNKWTFYDAVLLEVLAEHNDLGGTIFTQMFKKGKAHHLLRFLDEDSSFLDELKVILSTPKAYFIKGAFKVIFTKNDSIN